MSAEPAVIGPCPTCGELMVDQDGAVRVEVGLSITGRRAYLDFCTNACREGYRALP